ncbi:MAG: translation elongation factor Ts [Treponema sp.]|uniref:translation elongation factor Ts n=1 Tax=Treponema sp. TaxID=166 RepID=UPI00298EB33C|nr:translation elongation factor Ts [Treponema sp.]MCR5385716.1 translation elongation factor Ts [Treponema sp.]
MEISASDVKELREATGAGLMECKKALIEANGDKAEAAKILKEKGLAAVEKRAERATSEGRIFVRKLDNKVVFVELTCETDFVAKNTDFIALGEKLLDVTIEKGLTSVTEDHKKLLEDLQIKIRENMSVRNVIVVDIPAGCAGASYVHSDFKTASCVVIKGSDAEVVKTFAYDCCLHLAAFTPAYITKEDVPESFINEQKEIFKAQMDNDPKMAAKPDNVKEGILAGKIKKLLAENCFVDQMFVKDDKVSVAAKLAQVSKEAGAELSFATTKLIVLGK